jgi:hypothetical protein
MDASSTRAVKKVRKAPAGARWRVAVVAMALMHVATAPASGTVAHPGVPRSGESGHAHGAAEAPGQSLPPSAHNVELVGRLTFDDAARERFTDVVAFGGYAYLGAGRVPDCKRGGVYVIDISDPSAPARWASSTAKRTPSSPRGSRSSI